VLLEETTTVRREKTEYYARERWVPGGGKGHSIVFKQDGPKGGNENRELMSRTWSNLTAAEGTKRAARGHQRPGGWEVTKKWGGKMGLGCAGKWEGTPLGAFKNREKISEWRGGHVPRRGTVRKRATGYEGGLEWTGRTKPEVYPKKGKP